MEEELDAMPLGENARELRSAGGGGDPVARDCRLTKSSLAKAPAFIQ